MLREGLVFLQKRYHGEDTRRFQLIMAVILGVSIIVSFLLDALLPFVGWGNVMRAFVIIPLALSLFSLLYLYSLKLHDKRIAADDDWMPYRLRWSRTWRRRMAALGGALLFVVVYASSYHLGYTFIASLFATSLIALVAFIRPTRKELRLEALDVPDARDVLYDKRVQKREQERAEARELKERAKRRRRLLLGKDFTND